MLLVRLFISLHRLKPIHLPGADELMSSHAVQKPQITSTSDRLPNMARPPLIITQTDQRCLRVTSDPASCEPLLVCQFYSHIPLLVYSINCTRHLSSRLEPWTRSVEILWGTIGFVGCIRVADHQSAEELYGLLSASNSACSSPMPLCLLLRVLISPIRPPKR